MSDTPSPIPAPHGIPLCGHPTCRPQFEATELPSGRFQYRCLSCSCHVNPSTHVPGSEDCDRARIERLDSITADD